MKLKLENTYGWIYYSDTESGQEEGSIVEPDDEIPQ